MSSQSVPADIETSSDGYAARFAGPAGQWMLQVQEEAVLSMLPQDPGRVLDVGGGHGQLARPLCRRGVDVTVLGSDPVCERRIADLTAAGHCAYRTGDVSRLPFEDGAFETVLCFRLVCHCPEWPRLLAELCRVASCRVIIDYPTGRSLNALTGLFFGLKKSLEGNTRTYELFNGSELLKEFRRHGYAKRGRVRQFFWPMVLHRMLGRPGLSRALEWPPARIGLTRVFGSPVVLAVGPAGEKTTDFPAC